MSHRSILTTPHLLLAFATLAGLSTSTLAQPVKKTIVNPEIVREGSGAHRESLTAKELEAFDATALSKVNKWLGEKAPTATDMSGQVVLVCTWKYYHPTSKRAMENARKLAELSANQGLVVIAVHDSQGWDEAQKLPGIVDAARVSKFFVGYDEKGDFRRAIDSDGDPDCYLIDRAGQLRFADIATESVEPAIKMLLAESAETAAGVNGKLADEAEKKRRDAARSANARDAFDMSSIPAIPPGFVAPSPEAYLDARFPKTLIQLKDENSSSSDDKKAPPSIQIPEGEGWIGEKPELQGRVWVIYFWDFDEHRTYSVMQQMDDLQKARGRDVAVMGILTRFPKDSSGNEEKQEDPAKLQARVAAFTRGKALHHSTYIEPSGQLLTATRGGENTTVETIPIPYVVVCSSDGTVRFSGWAQHPSFMSHLDNTLALDPAVKARRAADAAYVKNKSK
ncbi:MAG: hypothetical protein IT435_08750 [Phycisphaerales bacterium]|nr:hypothetical protein [Phycisphaerales bacterium]